MATRNDHSHDGDGHDAVDVSRDGDRGRRGAAAGGPAVLVLASGKGERFIASGGQGSKLQALLAGRSVLQHTLDAVRASGLRWHVEDVGHPGMGDSIAAAVRAMRDADGWLVLPGDLPLVQAGTLRRVAQALQAGAGVVVPVHRGERGHPVGFARGCGDALAALSGPKGAAAVMQQHGVLELEVGDEGVVMDVDTVEALGRTEALVRRRQAAADGAAAAAGATAHLGQPLP